MIRGKNAFIAVTAEVAGAIADFLTRQDLVKRAEQGLLVGTDTR